MNPPDEKLVVTDLRVGSGPEVKSGDHVVMHYVGTLDDGTQFDSSYDRNQPFECAIGVGYVIKGWDMGILGMKAGGKRKLLIPYQLGYGKYGVDPDIPGFARLTFVVELLKIQSK